MSVAVVIMVAGWFYCAEPPDAAKKDMAQLEGEWTMVSAEANGQTVPEDVVKTGKRVVKGNETTVTLGDRVLMKAKFIVDPSKKPKQIDYTVTSEGANKGKVVKGIYEIDGDTVKFCFSGPDKDRPKEFSSPAESGHTYSVWKKEKK
jgi:uncharacterized protein (TIGR03067 family)